MSRGGTEMGGELALIDWRRRVAALYAAVRAEPDARRAHAMWRATRDALFATHPESPLPPGDARRASGLCYFDYDPRLRFLVEVRPPDRRRTYAARTDATTTTFALVGVVDLPAPVGARLGLWRLRQYGDGWFLPLRDATATATDRGAGRSGARGTGSDGASYGGGRYVLDTAKGADLGSSGSGLVVDLNFAYHPSCFYDSRFVCPLAPKENTIVAPVRAGERL